MLSIARLYWKTNLLLTQVVQKVFPDHWLWLKFDQFLKKIVGFAFTLNIHNYIVILANITFFKHAKSNGNDRLLHFPNWLNFIFLSNDSVMEKNKMFWLYNQCQNVCYMCSYIILLSTTYVKSKKNKRQLRIFSRFDLNKCHHKHVFIRSKFLIFELRNWRKISIFPALISLRLSTCRYSCFFWLWSHMI